MNPLDNALVANDIPLITHLLAADPGLLNRADSKGRTPIDLAVSRSSVEVVEFLITRDAHINRREYVYGNFPLFQAVARRRHDIVAVLLRYGADPTMKDNDGTSALALAVALEYLEIAAMLLEATVNQSRSFRRTNAAVVSSRSRTRCYGASRAFSTPEHTPRPSGKRHPLKKRRRFGRSRGSRSRRSER